MKIFTVAALVAWPFLVAGQSQTSVPTGPPLRNEFNGIVESVTTDAHGVTEIHMDSGGLHNDAKEFTDIFVPDYDCVRDGALVTGNWITDWNKLYLSMMINWSDPNATLNFDAEEMNKAWASEDSREEAMAQCPIGTLMICIHGMHLNEAYLNGPDRIEIVFGYSKCIQMVFNSIGLVGIAQSRWPVFESLTWFSKFWLRNTNVAKAQELMMGDENAEIYDLGCLHESRHKAEHWPSISTNIQAWATNQVLDFKNDTLDENIRDRVRQLLLRIDLMDRAQQECPIGFATICAMQTITSSNRFTMYMNNWAPCVEQALQTYPVTLLHVSGWPLFEILAFFSDMNKGIYGKLFADVRGDKGNTFSKSKEMRTFQQLPLFPEELQIYHRLPTFARSTVEMGVAQQLRDSLLANGHREVFGDFILQIVKAASRSPVGRHPDYFPPDLVEQIVKENGFSANSDSLGEQHATSDGGRRQFGRMLDCGWSGMTPQQCTNRGCEWAKRDDGPSCRFPEPIMNKFGYSHAQQTGSLLASDGIVAGKRPEVYVSFTYGAKWAELAVKMGRWFKKIGIDNLLIVAFGKEAQDICAEGEKMYDLICWSPPVLGVTAVNASSHLGMIGRVAAVQTVVQMGFDAIFFDMDTFFFQDPTKLLHSKYGKADVFVSSHFDGDCLNMGVFGIRSTPSGRRWLTRYLEWYYNHPYEIDQRGINAFLKYSSIKVSFTPPDLDDILNDLTFKVLDDGFEFTSTRGGWLGDRERLMIHHWCAGGPGKLDVLDSLYDYALGVPIEEFRSQDSLAYTMMKKDFFTENPPKRKQCW